MSYNKWKPNELLLDEAELKVIYEQTARVLVSKSCWYAHTLLTDQTKSRLNCLNVHIVDTAITEANRSSKRTNSK